MASEVRKKPALSSVGLAILAIVGLFILGDLTRRMVDARRLQLDAQILGTQVRDLEDEQTGLQTQVALATGEVMVEQWARSEAKMVGPGERLVVPIAPQGERVVPTPTPTPSLRLPSKWDVWWALLFGD